MKIIKTKNTNKEILVDDEDFERSLKEQWYDTGDTIRFNISRIKVCVNYVNISLGQFDTELEAASAYNKEAIKLFAEFAYLNVTEDGKII